MLKFNTSTGKQFTFPSSLKDITLRRYTEYLQLVEPTKPQELADVEKAYSTAAAAKSEKEKTDAAAGLDKALAAMDDIVMYRKIYPYYARVVAHFAEGITEAEIIGGKVEGDGMNIGNLEYLYSMLVQMLNNPEEPEYSQVIMVGDELWYLPQRFMEKSKLIEYAEAAQFEANLKDLQHGNWLALAKIMCVLVRKEGEQYSDKLLKREKMFMEWNLEDCLKVGFFLLKRSEISALSFQAFTAAQDLTRLKQE